MATLKLSEAMRLGSMLAPQGFGEYERDGATCALGSALMALGFNTQSADHHTLYSQWPICLRLTRCPVVDCDGPDGYCATILPKLNCVAVHLNDDHCWTRNQIADWIEQIENAKSPVVVADPPRPETVTP